MSVLVNEITAVSEEENDVKVQSCDLLTVSRYPYYFWQPLTVPSFVRGKINT